MNFSRNTIKKFKSLHPDIFRRGIERGMKIQDICRVAADRVSWSRFIDLNNSLANKINK